jgi:hypothetical protein
MGPAHPHARPWETPRERRTQAAFRRAGTAGGPRGAQAGQCAHGKHARKFHRWLLRRRPRLAHRLHQWPRDGDAGAAAQVAGQPDRPGRVGCLPGIARQPARDAVPASDGRTQRRHHGILLSGAEALVRGARTSVARRPDLVLPGHPPAQGRPAGPQVQQQPAAGGAGRRPPGRLALGCRQRPRRAGRTGRRDLRPARRDAADLERLARSAGCCRPSPATATSKSNSA